MVTIRPKRRVGIALGSLVAAWLVVGFVGGIVLPWFGIAPTPLPDPTPTASGVIQTVVAIVLGALIYRDIIRREQRSS